MCDELKSKHPIPMYANSFDGNRMWDKVEECVNWWNGTTGLLTQNQQNIGCEHTTNVSAFDYVSSSAIEIAFNPIANSARVCVCNVPKRRMFAHLPQNCLECRFIRTSENTCFVCTRLVRRNNTAPKTATISDQTANQVFSQAVRRMKWNTPTRIRLPHYSAYAFWLMNERKMCAHRNRSLIKLSTIDASFIHWNENENEAEQRKFIIIA